MIFPQKLIHEGLNSCKRHMMHAEASKYKNVLQKTNYFPEWDRKLSLLGGWSRFPSLLSNRLMAE